MTLFSLLRYSGTKTLKRYFSLKIDTIAISNSHSIEEKLDIIVINQNNIINGVYSLDKRVSILDKKVDEGFKAVNLRMDAMDKRMDGIDKRIDNLDKKVDEGFKAANMRMDGIDKELKELRKGQKNFDKKLDNFGEMLKNSLSTSAKAFEILCGKLIQHRFSIIQELEYNHEVQDTRTPSDRVEEIDIYSKNPLFIAECTIHMKTLKKLEKIIRKKKFIEYVYNKECTAVLIANKIEQEIISKVEQLSKESGIVLIFGEDLSKYE